MTECNNSTPGLSFQDYPKPRFLLNLVVFFFVIPAYKFCNLCKAMRSVLCYPHTPSTSPLAEKSWL